MLFVAYGSQYSFGVFFSALLAEFGWSRGSVSGIFSVYASLYCLVGFAAGRLTDAWGPRRVVALGAVFLGVGVGGMAAVTELWQPYVLYGIIGAVGMSTAYVPCHATVVRWFARRRGLAVGVAGSGASAGNFTLPLVAQLLVSTVGWRSAYVIFGLGIFVVLSATAPLLRRDPEGMGLRPDGDPSPPRVATEMAVDWPLRDAIRTSAFWLLAATFTAAWLPLFVPIVHIVPFSRDLGHSALQASSMLSAIGAGGVVGRLGMGAVSDLIGRKPSMAIVAGQQAAVFLVFLTVEQPGSLYLTALAYGFSYGAISSLFPAIVGDFFGRDRSGSLVGVLFALAGSIGSWGPFVAGVIYDVTGSYTPTFVLCAALSLVALLTLSLARPPADPLRP